MGIQRKRALTYVADTGKKFDVSKMSASHLLNVITHHLKQVDTLDFVMQFVNPPHHLLARKGDLLDTIRDLTEELAKRDPAGDIMTNDHDDWED